MAQISKGIRQTLTTKIPVEQIPQLDALQAATGENRSSILARIIEEYLNSESAHQLLAEREDGTLPLTA